MALKLSNSLSYKYCNGYEEEQESTLCAGQQGLAGDEVTGRRREGAA